MKKILNKIENAVDEMCKGIVGSNPNLVLDERYRIVMRKTIDKDKVALISGGGSGHEPAHAGYVGEGMLTAAICGDVFASPSTMQIYKAIEQTQTHRGTLLIIKNYSGDCMNFDSAAEMAEEDDILVDKVYVNDDIAVEDSLYTVGRRGVAGTVLVHKIAGAAAAEGRSLEEVKRIALKTIDSVKSIGVALTSCTVPAKGSPTFTLSENDIEYGVGIHGEPGIERRKLETSMNLAKDMVQRLLPESGLHKGESCAIMVNGLGATPLMELYIQYNDVAAVLKEEGIEIYKAFVGDYMTSLDMSGFSLTLLRLDDELKTFLDAPSNTVGMKI